MTKNNEVMDKQERIVCAAMFVRWKYKDIDFKNEEVICGVDHNLIRKISHFMDRRYNYDREYFSFEKGFVTNHNRFVDPIEAQKIAIAAGQYKCPNRAIKSLEEAIENRWFEINHTRNNMVFQTLKNYNRRDKEKIQQLKAGYLGYELRVEDLY